jgi:hypothetical protein
MKIIGLIFYVLYRGENLFLALPEEHNLKASNRVRRRIFEPTNDKTETEENCIRE